MSLYAQYLKERTNDKIHESETGFVVYRHLPEQKSTYIVDIFVKPEFRQKGLASKFADLVEVEAREHGSTKLIGTVQPSAKGSTDSLKALIGYGMKLQSSGVDFIIFDKEIV